MNQQEEKRFANKVGEEYELFSLALPHQDEIQKRSVDIMFNNFSKDQKLQVLEIGFGTGITSREILSRSENIYLIGIDNEPNMLPKASTKLGSFPANRFELHTIEAFEYLQKQPNQSIDAVISVWVLHNICKNFRDAILQEIYRVLKPGGIFVNGDKIAVDNLLTHKEHLAWQLKQFDIFENIGRPELKKEWHDHYIEDEDLERILHEDDFIEALNKLGFSNCKITDRHYMDAICSSVKFL